MCSPLPRHFSGIPFDVLWETRALFVAQSIIEIWLSHIRIDARRRITALTDEDRKQRETAVAVSVSTSFRPEWSTFNGPTYVPYSGLRNIMETKLVAHPKPV